MQVQKILQQDAKSRVVGVEDDLFTLHDLSSVATWNYELPTLVSGDSNEYHKKTIIRNNKIFKKNFFKTLFFLDKIDLSNLFIAGGSVRSLLLGQYINDVDIFVYGLKSDNVEAAAKKRVEMFILDIHDHLVKLKNGEYIKKKLSFLKKKLGTNFTKETEMKFYKDNEQNYKKNIETDMKIYYNGNTITFYVNRVKVQIILRIYNTISEILHGFDLGSSAVGFNGNLVYFTTLSKFCFENLVNIVDCSRRSTTYEKRLIKYFQNGFSLILPNLDITKMKTGYHKYDLSEVCEMPFLIFSYSKINGNSIYVDTFHQENGFQVNSDYDFFENIEEESFKLIHYNIGELIKGTHKYVRMINFEDEIEVLKSKKIDIRKKWNLNFNKTPFEYGFIEKFYNSMNNNLSSNKINFDTINRFINVTDSKTFINEVYLSGLTLLEKKTKINDILNKQKLWFKTELDKIKTSPINWITENPTSQLTSSINPIIADESEWYGTYYISHEFNNICDSDDDNETKESPPVDESFTTQARSDRESESSSDSDKSNDSGDDSDEELSTPVKKPLVNNLSKKAFIVKKQAVKKPIKSINYKQKNNSEDEEYNEEDSNENSDDGSD